MSEESKEKKDKIPPAQKHFLPESYAGICSGEQPFVRGFAQQAKNDPKNKMEQRHVWEFRMPIPKGLTEESTTVQQINASLQELYGEKASLDLVVRSGILGWSRSADDKAKPAALADGKPLDEAQHLAMQRSFEEWRPGTREQAAASVEKKLEKATEGKSQEEILYDLLKIGRFSREQYEGACTALGITPRPLEE